MPDSRRLGLIESHLPPPVVPKTVSLFPSCRSLLALTVCATLVACAGSTDPPAPAVSRTPAPRGYEDTITNFFAFKIRAPEKNTRISFSPPEPGSCGLDGYLNSMRGWVVPVVYETLKDELAGKERIQITAKQYYFWFFGNTIAAVTRRGDRCPGLGSAFDDPAPAGAIPGRVVLPAQAIPRPAEALQRERVDMPVPRPAGRAQQRTKPPSGKDGDVQRAKKNARTSAGVRHPEKRSPPYRANRGRPSDSANAGAGAVR